MVKEAFSALQQKLTRENGNKRQNERRLKAEPFKLSDSQIMLLTYRYKAARNEDREVDNANIADSKHFSTL